MKTSELNKTKVEQTIRSYVNRFSFSDVIIGRAIELYLFKYEFYSDEVSKGHTREMSEEEIERITIKNVITWLVTKYPQTFSLPENPSTELMDICVNDLLLEKGK
jgi:hypothetical protein